MSDGLDPFDQNRQEPAMASSPAVELDDLLARPVSLRRHIVRGAVIAVAVVVLILLLGVPTLTNLQQADTHARATRTASAITTSLTVTSNLTFGSLTLDGKPLSGLIPQRVVLHEGRHTIALVAKPFNPVTCQLFISAASGGTNIRIEAPSGDALPCSQVDASTLIIPVTGANLSEELQQSARARIQQTLAQLPAHTVVIASGAVYASQADAQGMPLSRRATAPLTATVSLAPRDPLTENVTLATLAPLTCESGLCASSFALNYGQELTHPAWYIDAAIAEHWRFTTQAGQEVGMLQVPSDPSVSGGLTYDPTSGWAVAAGVPGTPLAAPFVPEFASDPCGAGMSLLTWMFKGDPSAAVGQMQSGSDPLQGCTLTEVSQSVSYAQFVWRLGALFAADERAHQLQPTLPVATQAELKAAGG